MTIWQQIGKLDAGVELDCESLSISRHKAGAAVRSVLETSVFGPLSPVSAISEPKQCGYRHCL